MKLVTRFTRMSTNFRRQFTSSKLAPTVNDRKARTMRRFSEAMYGSGAVDEQHLYSMSAIMVALPKWLGCVIFLDDSHLALIAFINGQTWILVYNHVSQTVNRLYNFLLLLDESPSLPSIFTYTTSVFDSHHLVFLPSTVWKYGEAWFHELVTINLQSGQKRRIQFLCSQSLARILRVQSNVPYIIAYKSDFSLFALIDPFVSNRRCRECALPSAVASLYSIHDATLVTVTTSPVLALLMSPKALCSNRLLVCLMSLSENSRDIESGYKLVELVVPASFMGINTLTKERLILRSVDGWLYIAIQRNDGIERSVEIWRSNLNPVLDFGLDTMNLQATNISGSESRLNSAQSPNTLDLMAVKLRHQFRGKSTSSQFANPLRDFDVVPMPRSRSPYASDWFDLALGQQCADGTNKVVGSCDRNDGTKVNGLQLFSNSDRDDESSCPSHGVSILTSSEFVANSYRRVSYLGVPRLETLAWNAAQRGLHLEYLEKSSPSSIAETIVEGDGGSISGGSCSSHTPRKASGLYLPDMFLADWVNWEKGNLSPDFATLADCLFQTICDKLGEGGNAGRKVSDQDPRKRKQSRIQKKWNRTDRMQWLSEGSVV